MNVFSLAQNNKKLFCWSQGGLYIFYLKQSSWRWNSSFFLNTARRVCFLKGLSYEIDFENFDENWQILALIRAAAGF